MSPKRLKKPDKTFREHCLPSLGRNGNYSTLLCRGAPSTPGLLCAPRPSKDKQWPLDISSCWPGSVGPAWRAAGRLEAVLGGASQQYAPCPTSKPHQKIRTCSRVRSTFPGPGRNSGGWPKLGTVTGAVTSPQIPVRWLAGNLCDSKLLHCCS